MHLKALSLFICLITAPGLALADDRPEHYSGETSETLEEALQNLRDYSDELASIVQKDDFDSGRLHSVHEITYTLENALQRLDKELEQLAETLESVHLASERGETDTVAQDSAIFIRKTRLLLQQAPEALAER